MANSQKGKIDMTTGHIMRNIILFAIPIIIGNVLQQLYTTVDALVIGKYCGDTSLAAVGTSSQPVEVLLCVFLGIGTGVSILISQYTGARESRKVVSVCGTSIIYYRYSDWNSWMVCSTVYSGIYESAAGCVECRINLYKGCILRHTW
jgi:Na+-driven multidrug efflux pump